MKKLTYTQADLQRMADRLHRLTLKRLDAVRGSGLPDYQGWNTAKFSKTLRREMEASENFPRVLAAVKAGLVHRRYAENYGRAVRAYCRQNRGEKL